MKTDIKPTITDTTCNGWKNRATWNVALWIGNDELLYSLAKDCDEYQNFVDEMHNGSGGSNILQHTPDGYSWTDPTLDIKALDTLIGDLSP